jgi:predicted nicotinamide N-methyase
VELGAGCGLVSAVLGRLGAVVTTTDLEENLPLLRENLAANALGAESAPRVRPLRWGRAAAQALRDEELQGRVNFVVASDVMYIADAVPDLVATLRALCDEQTTVLLAHGRNRPAEEAFLAAAAPAFSVEVLADDELHKTFQCLDVSVLRLRLR